MYQLGHLINFSMLVNQNNEIEEENEVWEEYIQNLFANDRPNNNIVVDSNLICQSISKDGIKKDITSGKTREAECPDKFPRSNSLQYRTKSST